VVGKQLLALMAALLLLVNGCGGGDDAEAKQAALAPATTVDPEADEPTVAKPADSTPAPAPAKPEPPKPVAVADSTAVATNADDSTLTPGTEHLARERESFSYTGGSRDPFVSLLANTRIGPELPDLVLVAIYYDTRNPNSSVVVMREKVTNKKYNLRPGDRLGRMRVAGVRPKDVTFSIDDFGTERQETVSLRKGEDNQ
jgi:hypothetical protein